VEEVEVVVFDFKVHVSRRQVEVEVPMGKVQMDSSPKLSIWMRQRRSAPPSKPTCILCEVAHLLGHLDSRRKQEFLS